MPITLQLLASPIAALVFALSPQSGIEGAGGGTDFELEFDLFDDGALEAARPDPQIGESAALRRRMLQAHQIAGLSTLGLMTATVVLGQLNYNDHFGESGSGTGAYSTPHRIAAYGTAGAFAVTGALSLLAPVPYEQKGGFDTGSVHRIAAFGATAGLAGQIVLGVLAGQALRSGKAERLEQLGSAHRATGYITLALLTTAAVSWVF